MQGGRLLYMKTLTTQLKIPEESSKLLKIEAIKAGLTLRQYCVKVLCEHVKAGE
jgi:predicted HicB family RNase H-like nuclease